MTKSAYILLNSLFHIFHLATIFFCLIGWIFAATRLAHFIWVLLILASWFGLGKHFGFGYCLITDIQWRIKRKYGEIPSTEYYVKYMIDKILDRETNPKVVDTMTTYIFYGIAIISALLNLLTLLKII